ncbi:MAG: hypothetical protein D6737_16565 [Chloroflexi bacterium]|nr:MAG: hypothetical protein D6737_16565 [Chloroflexota bacterium]
MPDELEPIPGDEARVILREAIRERLGDDWQQVEDGWEVVSQTDYRARLTKGGTNLDFYVDLVGEVTVEEKPVSPGQDVGRLIAWMLLLLALTITFLFARAVGWL